MDNLGNVLVVLCILSFLLFLLRVLLITCRSYTMSLRLKEEQARRQMEIEVTNNNCNNCSGASGGVANVCVNNQVSVLPKTLDLPPSYDEAAFSDRKQDSTLTLATCLEASNPNLAEGGTNEPPPVYEANVATTMTTTTTSTFLVNGQPPVV